MDGISVKALSVITVNQDRVNNLLADAVSGDTSVSCFCEDGNILRLGIRSRSHGMAHLRIRLLEARHDRAASTVKFQLLDRKLDGNPLKALLLANMPDSALRFLLKLFALPPTIRVENAGDVYTLELHEWLAKSPLGSKEIMGVRLIDCIRISGFEVKEGQISAKGRINIAS